MATAPNGHLLVTNALNGQVVEVDPLSGQQIRARWIDPNKAQKPPGSGDFFPHTPPSTIPSTSNAISPQPKRTACFALWR